MSVSFEKPTRDRNGREKKETKRKMDKVIGFLLEMAMWKKRVHFYIIWLRVKANGYLLPFVVWPFELEKQSIKFGVRKTMVRREVSTQLAIYIRCWTETKGTKTKRKFYVYFTHLINNNGHFEFKMVSKHLLISLFLSFFLTWSGVISPALSSCISVHTLRPFDSDSNFGIKFTITNSSSAIEYKMNTSYFLWSSNFGLLWRNQANLWCANVHTKISCRCL